MSDLLFESTQLFMALSETWLCDHVEADLHIKGNSPYSQVKQRHMKWRDYNQDYATINTEVIFNVPSGVIDVL